MKKLNIDEPQIITKATDNIQQMIEYVEKIKKSDVGQQCESYRRY